MLFMVANLRFSEKRIRDSNGGDDHSLMTSRAKALQKDVVRSKDDVQELAQHFFVLLCA